jgi:PilZ domain
MRDIPNRILDFLTAKPKPAGDACRSNPRRQTTARVELAWLDGKEWRTIPARLRDISRGGACLLARSEPPLTRSARLRIVQGEGSPWIEVEILGIERDSPTRYQVRLRFAEPCPNFLLRMAVLGAEETVEQPVAPEGWVAWSPVGTE